jgi:hypothetical protein
MRNILALAFLLATICAASAENSSYPSRSIAVTATGTGTTSASATLPATPGNTTYICGFQATSAGTTAGTITITNTVTTLNYTLAGTAPIVVNFQPCIPSNAPGTTVVVSGAFTGGTASSVNCYGYQYLN